MFVVVSDIKIKPEAVEDFKKWFSEANKVVSQFDGFVSRRLLETKDGQHRVLVEFESLEKFGKMWAAMAITEPGSGSDSGSITTTAVLDGCLSRYT